MNKRTYFRKIFVRGILFPSLCFCCVIGSAQTVRYVKNGGTSSSGASAATSWNAACSDLQTVVNTSSVGDTVFVMAGNYPGRFTLKEGVQVYGGFAGTESYTTQRVYAINNTVATTSVLDGENTGRVLTQLTPFTLSTVWDGFVLKNGNAVISEMEVGSVIFGKAGTEFYNVPAGIFFWYNSSINTGFMMGLNANELIQTPDNSDVIGIPNLDYSDAIVDYNGLAYTNVLAALYPAGNYAANWAVSLTDGGYTDWHLPSMGELAELCTYKTQINSALTLLGKPTLTNSVRNSCSETSASPNPPNFAVSLGMFPCAGGNVAKTKSSLSSYHPYHYISPSDLDNLAFCGGGALIQENGILRRCIVEDSKASYKGGGIYIETGGRVEGCLVHSNRSPSGFGIYTNGGVVTSSTIADNQEIALPDGATLPVETAGLAISNSTVTNVITSSNTDMALVPANCNSMLNADSYVGDAPGFTAAGNYLLAGNSSLRGTGNVSLVPAELLLDLDLNPRITAYNTIDPGAYQTEGIREPLHFYVTVEANPTGNGSGSDWDNSMSNLSFSYQLKTSQPGDTFYVAAGTYYPQLDSSGTVPSSPRNATYKPNHGVTIIGSYKTGLTGTANDLVNDRILTDASGELAPTTLFSGDIDGDGVTGDPDDVYIVIWGEHNTTGEPVSLNGIEVSHAYAGGIILKNTDLILDYCKITKNRGMNYSFVGGFIGGIIYSQSGNCMIRNSSIMENNLEGDLAVSDGVVDVVNGDLSIYNSVIGKNVSGFVSAVSFSGSAANTLKIYNSTISDNQTYDTELGAIYIANEGSTVDIRNATIVDNTCMYNASGSGIVILNKSMGPSSPVFIGPGTFNIINTILSGSTGSDIILLEQTYFGPGAPFEPNATYMGGAIYQTPEYSANPPVHSIIATNFYNGGATGTPVTFNTTPSYLSALSYNGGFTQTRALTGADNYALANGFPGYSGSSGAPEGLSLDQRLVTRKDPAPSIGAFEYRAPQTGFYVTVDANPTGDGSGIDWDNSMSNLSFSKKLLTAQPGDTFYVAGGVYYPQVDASGNENPTNVKNKTYILKPGVSIIGSYKTDLTGTANDLTDDRMLVDASGELSPGTVFSGDLDGSGTVNSNDISVMMGAYNDGTESAPVYLNGFEVTYAYSGGIYASNTNLEIDFCKIDSVRGSTGLNVGGTDIGGVLVSLNGNCTVRNSAIVNNIHQGGSGNFGIVKIANGNFHIYNSVIAHNNATGNSASAIYFVEGVDHTLGIYNSTITDNTTSGSFGAVFIARGTLAVEIINSTIVDNMALNTNITAGITIENGMDDDWSGFDFKGPASFKLDNTIVSGNTNANIVLLNWDLFGGYSPAGTDGGIYLFQIPNTSTFPYQNNPPEYTLIGSDFYNGISGIPVTFNTSPAYLAPLAYNGGFTRTRALLRCDNYAIDHGNPAYTGTAVVANNLNKDQRGILRREPAPSIGAYDIGERSLTTGTIQIVAQPGCAGNNGEIRLSVTGGSGNYQYSIDNTTFTDLASGGIIGNLAPGTYRFYIQDKIQVICGTYISDAITLEATDHGMNFRVIAENASSCGVNDGQLQLFISGGTPTYQYQLDGGNWIPFVSGDYIEDVTSGIHVVNVKDDNGTGCLVSSGEVTVKAADSGLAVNISDVNNTGCGNTNGAFTLTITGGTAPYHYQIDGGQLITTDDHVIHVANLGAGSHSWKVTDATGCYAEGRQLLHNGPDALLVSVVSTIDADCSGTGGGSITLRILMGGGNYEYSINGRGFTALPADGVIPDLAVGTYDIVIRDGTGCTFEYQNIRIEDRQTAVVSIGTIFLAKQPTCNNADGEIQLYVTGISGNYQYRIGETGSYETLPANGLITGVSAGSYRIYVIDDAYASCPAAVSDVITLATGNSTLDFVTKTSDATGCGMAGGSITLIINGGVAPYEYSLDGGEWTTFTTGKVLPDLTPGTYVINVKDVAGCAAGSGEVIVGAGNNGLQVMATAIIPTDCEETKGSFTLVASNGTAPYRYQLDGGDWITSPANIMTIDRLAAGNYVWRVEDNTGCYKQDHTIIHSNTGDPLSVTVTTTPANCSGLADGSITLTITGGTGNYQYSFDGGVSWEPVTGNKACLENRAAGIYDLMIKDGSNCIYQYQNATIDIGVSLKLTAFLEGPINGVLMTNYLQEPDYSFENSMLTEPRHPVLNPYGIEGVYHSSIGTSACHAGQVVDWIKVEIRKVNDPKTILQEKALLLKPDGSIIDTNGRTPVFNVETEPVHIVVSHRNHLSIVTPVLPQFSMLKGCHSYDFSTSLSQAFKFDPADPDPMVESPAGSGIWCMWAGDTNWDEIIENEDDRNVNEDSKAGLLDAYLTTDLNHDGITENRDDNKVRINSTLGIYSPLFWWILLY